MLVHELKNDKKSNLYKSIWGISVFAVVVLLFVYFYFYFSSKELNKWWSPHWKYIYWHINNKIWSGRYNTIRDVIPRKYNFPLTFFFLPGQIDCAMHAIRLVWILIVLSSVAWIFNRIKLKTKWQNFSQKVHLFW